MWVTHVPMLLVFHDSLKVQPTKTFPGREGDFRAEPLCGWNCSRSHENAKCFPIVQTHLRFLNHFGGKMLSNYFIFWFSATHLKLTPWPPLTIAKGFHEPGTPLPAVGISEACDEWPPACKWDLVVPGASWSWNHRLVISPWVRANSHCQPLSSLNTLQRIF